MRQVTPPLRGEYATLGDALLAAAVQFADHEAYVDGTRRLTFGEWFRAADGLAADLVHGGVQPGDVVAIMLPPSIDYAVAAAAIALAGGVATGINVRLGPHEVESIFARAEPVTTFVTSEADPPPGVPSTAKLLDLDAIAGAGSGPGLGDQRPPRTSSDPAVIIWTSGTTGLPKGAWFDHDNLRAAVTTAGVMTEAFDRRLAAVPFAHAGYMAKLWEQIAWATTLVITPTPWRASDTLALLVDEHITVAGAVPAQWAKLLEEPALDRADLSALRLGVAATAPAAPELVQRVVRALRLPARGPLHDDRITFDHGHGSRRRARDPVPHRRSSASRRGAGAPRRGRIPVGVGQVGRVHLRGPCVMRGYWREPDLTAEVLDEAGWLRSSDLGHLDGDGYLALDGRVGDMYIRGGYNVYPLEVENVLVEHPDVDQAAVVGVPAPVLGEIGVAFLVVAPGSSPPSLAVLRTWCEDRLADYKAPDRVVVVDALPLTSMLKVDKSRLRDEV